jgi:hypothetical protein
MDSSAKKDCHSTSNSTIVHSTSPFPLCILQAYLLQRAEEKRTLLDVRLENLQIEAFAGIVALWLSRLVGTKTATGLSELEKDMVQELLV